MNERERNIVVESPGIRCAFCGEERDWAEFCQCPGAMAWRIAVENYEAAHPGPKRPVLGYYS